MFVTDWRGGNIRIDRLKETSYKKLEKCELHLEILFNDKLGIEENIIIERTYSYHLKAERIDQEL